MDILFPPFGVIEVALFEAIASICRCNIRPVAICKIPKCFDGTKVIIPGSEWILIHI
jgi:hypothetical protein